MLNKSSIYFESLCVTFYDEGSLSFQMQRED